METSHSVYNYTPPNTRYFYAIELHRNVLLADVRKQKLSKMPGYRLTWHYSGMEVEAEAQYRNKPVTKAFVRNYSNNIPIY